MVNVLPDAYVARDADNVSFYAKEYIMKIHDALFRWLRQVLYIASVTGMSLMLVMIFFQVISRYIFGFSFSWSEELARFLFVWVVFIGGALIMGEGGHIAVRLLPEIVKGTTVGVALDIIINVFSVIFILILIVKGSGMTQAMMFQIAPGLGIPMGAVYSIIPVSGVLMLLYIIRDIASLLAVKQKSEQDKEK